MRDPPKFNCVSAPFEYNKQINHQFPIYLVQQWYVNPDPVRHDEHVHVLTQNLQNTSIDKIYFLNERKYTLDEMGITKYIPNISKIEQVVVSKRLSFQLAWKTMNHIIQQKGVEGYIVLSNLDIFFNESIHVLNHTDYHIYPTCITNCRYDYYPIQDLYDQSYSNINQLVEKENTYTLNGKTFPIYNKKLEAIVIPHISMDGTSQDSWMIHSNHLNHLTRLNDTMHIQLGTAKCDNVILTLLFQQGLQRVEGSVHITSYHYQMTDSRNYIRKLFPAFEMYLANAHLTEKDHERIFSMKQLMNPTNQIFQNIIIQNNRFETKLSGRLEDQTKLSQLFFHSISNSNSKPVYISYLDLPYMTLLKVFHQLKRKDIRIRTMKELKDTQTSIPTQIDLLGYILFKWFINIYSQTNYSKREIYQNIDYMSSIVSQIQGPSSRLLFNMLSHFETVVKHSSVFLFKHYDVSQQFKHIFNGIQKNTLSPPLSEILTNRSFLSYESLNPIWFVHKDKWTHSLKGSTIGIVSLYGNEIQENIHNYSKCFPSQFFIHNTFTFFDLPKIENHSLLELYDTIQNENKQFQHFNPLQDKEEQNNRMLNQSKLFYTTLRNTTSETRTTYTETINRFKEWLNQVDVVLLDTSSMNSIFMYCAITKKTSCIVLGDVLRLYFGVYTERDEELYGLSLQLYKNNYWKKA